MNSRRKWPQVIDYTKELRITNIDQLTHGTGAKFLETMTAHNGDHIAIAWHRKILDTIPTDHVLIAF